MFIHKVNIFRQEVDQFVFILHHNFLNYHDQELSYLYYSCRHPHPNPHQMLKKLIQQQALIPHHHRHHRHHRHHSDLLHVYECNLLVL